MTARLLGIGTATPMGGMDQAAALAMVAAIGGVGPRRARAMEQLYQQSGVERRAMAIVQGPRQAFYNGHPPGTDERMRAFQRLAPPLAHDACVRALAHAGVAPAGVTHLVTASCTGMASPGVDIALIQSLGLSAETQRTHVGFMGCHAALNALRVARAIALAEPVARVLVCCVELCSLHVQAGQPGGSAVADALFADGAAACVVARSGDTHSHEAHAPALHRTASTLLPGTLSHMGWTIGGSGFTMALSPKVPATLAASVRPWVESVLAMDGLTIAGVPSWAIHPGGPRVLEAVADALGLPQAARRASAAILREHGNMSSATVPFILERLLRDGAPRPILALAFGPGLTGEALLLTEQQ